MISTISPFFFQRAELPGLLTLLNKWRTSITCNRPFFVSMTWQKLLRATTLHNCPPDIVETARNAKCCSSGVEFIRNKQ